MPSLRAYQHLFSSVDRGFFPQNRHGFQTVALSEELIGTPDLRELENASVYSLSRERQSAGDSPVKETFFRLPSGNVAVGRIIHWRNDSSGREGNYLAYHLVIAPSDLISLENNPFCLLDAPAMAVAQQDLTPRILPPLTLETSLQESHSLSLATLPLPLLTALLSCILEQKEKAMLWIGEEARTRQILSELFSLLPLEERLELTFSTHFYTSDHLRALFAFVSVRSRSEAPANPAYALFELETATFPSFHPPGAYAQWLANAISAHRSQEITAFNTTLNRLRQAPDARPAPNPPENLAAFDALWEKAGDRAAITLLGAPALLSDLLQTLPSPRPLADALCALSAISPTELLGTGASSESTEACLTALRAAAKPQLWEAWRKRWNNDPLLAPFHPEPRSVWRLFGRR